MGKSKTVFWVLASVVLLVWMAFLPGLTAWWQDRTVLGTAATGPIQTVELNFRTDLPGIGLLAMMDQAENWQIVDKTLASMTQAEAEQAASLVWQAYQEAGLVESSLDFRIYRIETTALSLPTGEGRLVWVITMLADDKTYGEMNLALDDTTGQVIHLSYTSNPKHPEEVSGTRLQAFAAVFFQGLGIDNYARYATQELEGAYIGDSAVAIRYRFWEPEFGAEVVDFYVYPNGFYTDFITNL